MPKLTNRRIEKPDVHIVAARKLLLRHHAASSTEVACLALHWSDDMVMLSKDHWHAAISDERKSCGESRMLAPWTSMKIMHGFHETVCLLCDSDDFMFCQKCFIPWSANWIECMNVESMSPRQRFLLDSARQLLCYTCIYNREYELDSVNRLTDDQEAQLAKVKEYMINTGGGPPLELVSVRLL
jgi:hypothetical protein